MGMSIYYIDIKRKSRNTAGAKAPNDIAELCRKFGYRRIAMPAYPQEKPGLYQKLWLLTVCIFYWYKVMTVIPCDSVVLYQHPQYGIRVANKMIPLIKRRKNCKFICIIHDLESLRGGIQGVVKDNKRTNYIADDVLLRQMDSLICHNKYMKEYLISRGFQESGIVSLGIFDYLADGEMVSPDTKSSPSIAIAGNLAKGKCAYIYKIFGQSGTENKTLSVHLFGNNYSVDVLDSRFIYHGSFKPEDLPSHLKGDYGLVWDGDSAETCSGNTGEYLKYNNPHKTSLYLASGMPVIVWRQAAIADFVLDNGVGIAVESLYEIEDAIIRVDKDEYNEMCRKTRELGKKIRQGYFFGKAMEKAYNLIG